MKITKGIQYEELLFFIGIGLVSFLPFLGVAPLFDWDEINFAEATREMMATGDYFRVQINYLPFWEKPPLFFWLQVLSMKLFGVNEYAARLPNAIIGVFTLAALYIDGTRVKDNLFGKLVAGFYFASILPHLYFKSGIIDPTFNFFIFLGIVNLIRFESGELPGQLERAYKPGPWKAGLWIGLAVLTKGPVALLIFGLTFVVFKLIFDRFRIKWMAVLKFFFVLLLIIGAWFGSLVLFTPEGWEIVQLFLKYQIELFSQDVAGHGQPFYYHFVVFLLGCFPLAAFAFRGMFVKYIPSPFWLQHKFMLVWFWVVMIVFSIVKTKIVHYSSLLYFPGAYLAAHFVYQLIEKKRKVPWDSWVIFALGLLVFGGLLSSMTYLVRNLQVITNRTQDPFILASLGIDVNWTGWEFVPALVFLAGSLVGILLLNRGKFQLWLGLQMVCTAILLNGLNLGAVPKIAQHTQGAPQEFYLNKQGEDAYFLTVGFKSYAHYFYARTRPIDYLTLLRTHSEFGDGPNAEERLRAVPVKYKERLFHTWLARGEVDKQVYLVIRKPEDEDILFVRSYWGYEKLYEKGGYAFYHRPPGPALPPD